LAETRLAEREERAKKYEEGQSVSHGLIVAERTGRLRETTAEVS
jgi:hypothetical protein